MLGLAVLLTLRRRHGKQVFPISVTQELKGLAVLAVVIAHFGYLISSDSRFMSPLSNYAGIGVDIFLFLSGFGLTISHMKHKLSILQFYNKRLKKLYIPLWITLTVLFLMDFFILHRSYPLRYIGESVVGIFRTANNYHEVDSPLWYFTMIAFYYLLYPLVFLKKRPWLSAFIIFGITYFILHHTQVKLIESFGFYKIYTIAFPLGIIAAWASTRAVKLKSLAFYKRAEAFYHRNKMTELVLRYPLLITLVAAFFELRRHTGPFDSPLREQFYNVLSMLVVMLFFMVKRWTVKLFYLFGLYSYEIYLLHVPLVSRYDIFFRNTYPWLAVVLYLSFFVVLGWLLSVLQTLPGKIHAFDK